MIRQAEAPRARRVAISNRRSWCRASSRFITLAHAISRIRLTTACTMVATARVMPSRRTFGQKFSLALPRLSGYKAANWLIRVSVSAWACFIVTPGFTRAIRPSVRTSPRRRNASSGKGAMMSGVHMEA